METPNKETKYIIGVDAIDPIVSQQLSANGQITPTFAKQMEMDGELIIIYETPKSELENYAAQVNISKEEMLKASEMPKDMLGYKELEGSLKVNGIKID